MDRRLICFGHRGAAGHEPENTLLSVEKAISLGADWIEVDVHRVGDELLVFHDETLERTTNGTGRISERSLDYLRSLDAGKGQRIPFLREVFDLVDRRAGINIELKGLDTAGPTVALIDRYVERHAWTHDRFLVSSFDYAQLETTTALQPKVKIGVLAVSRPLKAIQFAHGIEAFSFNSRASLLNRQIVQQARDRALQVYAFTVNEMGEIRRLRDLGVNGVFTDFPERVAQAGL